MGVTGASLIGFSRRREIRRLGCGCDRSPTAFAGRNSLWPEHTSRWSRRTWCITREKERQRTNHNMRDSLIRGDARKSCNISSCFTLPWPLATLAQTSIICSCLRTPRTIVSRVVPGYEPQLNGRRKTRLHSTSRIREGKITTQFSAFEDNVLQSPTA